VVPGNLETLQALLFIGQSRDGRKSTEART
jgi:hypothetical protein